MSEIAESDRDKLAHFIRCVDEMCERRLIKSGKFKRLEFSFHISRNDKTNETQIDYNITELDEEDFRSFLLIFRQFILQGEPIFVDYILGVVYKYLKPEHRSMQQNVSNVWKEAKKGNGKTFFYDGNEKLSPEEIIKLWLYGDFFHGEIDKTSRINAWKEGGLLIMYQKELLFAVHDMFNTIVWIRRYIEDGLSNSWLDFDNPHY